MEEQLFQHRTVKDAGRKSLEFVLSKVKVADALQLEDDEWQLGEYAVGNIDSGDGVQGHWLGARMQLHLRVEGDGSFAEPLWTDVLETLLSVPVDHDGVVGEDLVAQTAEASSFTR